MNCTPAFDEELNDLFRQKLSYHNFAKDYLG